MCAHEDCQVSVYRSQTAGAADRPDVRLNSGGRERCAGTNTNGIELGVMATKPIG